MYFTGTRYTQAIASTWRETAHFLITSHRYFWWTERTLNNVGNGYIPGLSLHSRTARWEHRSDGRNWSLPLSRLWVSRRSQDQVSSLLTSCSPLSLWHWLSPSLFPRSDSLATGCVKFYIPFYPFYIHFIMIQLSSYCPTWPVKMQLPHQVWHGDEVGTVRTAGLPSPSQLSSGLQQEVCVLQHRYVGWLYFRESPQNKSFDTSMQGWTWQQTRRR